MTFLYKVFWNEFDCPSLLNLFSLPVSRRVPTPQPLATTNLKKFSVTCRLPKNCNRICVEVGVIVNKLPTFKILSWVCWSITFWIRAIQSPYINVWFFFPFCYFLLVVLFFFVYWCVLWHNKMLCIWTNLCWIYSFLYT